MDVELVSMQCRMSNVDVRVLSTNTASLRCHTRPDVRLGEHRSKVVRSQKDVEAVAVAVGLEGGGAGAACQVKSQDRAKDRDWRRRIER